MLDLLHIHIENLKKDLNIRDFNVIYVDIRTVLKGYLYES